jgi:hypothetical protein
MSGTTDAPVNADDVLRQALSTLLNAGGGAPTVQMPQVQAPQNADMGPPTSFFGRLGEGLGGSAASLIPMTTEQREAQGRANLRDFWAGLASQPFGGPGVGIAEGISRAEQAAQQPLVQTEALTKLAGEQQQMQLNRVKAATDLLTAGVQLRRLGIGAGMPNLLAGGGAGGADASAAPGTRPANLADVIRDPKFATAGQQANNPGNLMTTSAPGQTGVINLSGGRPLAVFPDVQTGIAANAANLAAYATDHGITTVADAVKRWVGDPKADLTSYTNDVANALGVKPTDKIDLTDPAVQAKFIMAQQPHESGRPWLNPDDVQQGVALAQQWRKGGPPVASAPAATAATTGTPPAPTAPPALAAKPPAGAPQPAPETYSSKGAPIGTDLVPQVPPVAGLPDQTPPAAATIKGTPIPAGRLQSTGKPPGVSSLVPGDVNAILGGMNLAQATPVDTTAQTAGGTVTPTLRVPPTVMPAATGPTPPGFGQGAFMQPGQTTIGPQQPPTAPTTPAPATTTGPATPTPQVSTQQPTPPGGQTWEQFLTQHMPQPTPEVEATWHQAPDPATLREYQAEKATAAQELSAARSLYGPGSKEANSAQERFQAASQNLAGLTQKYSETNATALQKWRQDQATLLAPIFQKQQELAATAAENDKNRANELAKIQATAGTTERTAALTPLNTESAAAAHRLDDLQVLKGFSDNLGNPTFLTSAKIGGRSLADIISGAGIGSQALQDKAGQAQAFHAATLSIVRDLRLGGAASGEPRSNQDLQFITDMVPSEMQSPATRNAIISYIEQVNQRRMEYAAEVGRLVTTPEYQNNVGGAMLTARKAMPDIIQAVPKEIATGGGDVGNERLKWFRENVAPGTFYRAPNGRMQVWHGVPGEPGYMP